MDQFPTFWLAELDEQLHDCHLPPLRRGRTYTCECGCIWEALRAFSPRGPVLRWALTRDPDQVGR
jgi:hypothetical protein